MSCCSWPTRYVEKLWELKGVRRARLLAEVVVCAKHHKPIGELRRANTGRYISDEEWARMLACRPMPPWYFVATEDGELYPEGYQASKEPA